MKKIFLFISLFCSLSVFSQTISFQKAEKIAQSFIKSKSKSSKIDTIHIKTQENGDTLFYVVNFKSNSYVIVSGNMQMSPIIAWSDNSVFYLSEGYFPIVIDAISIYLEKTKDFSISKKENILKQWRVFENKKYRSDTVHVWPEEGTTETGGWINTRWTQTSPYNKLCPRDPVLNELSYAGCPAITMGQILNCLKTTQNTRFTDDDDYSHNYDGRNYNIDDDYATIGFPSFPQLNSLLDSIDNLFVQDVDITDTAAAVLVFASGTACKQIYTSQGSGTFEVNQAYQAYKRFAFNNCELFTTVDSVMYENLINNLINGYPAHLAVVDEGWSTGHNVAVDGYRDDGYFHINFGWGGLSDGWWLIPDPSFPYSMGVLEGIVLNIIPDITFNNNVEKIPENLEIYPNPIKDTLIIKNFSCECKL